MFTPSTGEAIVGRGVAGRYQGAQLGEELEFGRGRWQVVGVFESNGSSFESEVWVDVRELANDAKRTIPYSGFRLRVADGADMDALDRGASATIRATRSRRSARPTTTRSKASPRTRSTCW